MSRLKHLVDSMEPQIGQRSCKLIFDSSCGAVNRRAPKKTVGFTNPKKAVGFTNAKKAVGFTDTKKTVGFVNALKKPRKSLVAARISFFEDKECQLKIAFDDHATTTFEYKGEDEALEEYLDRHPEEREEALKQELESNSDSIAQEQNEEATRESPRLVDTDALRSNTVIGQPTGALTNYKSKMQIDFQFGVPTESSDDVDYDPEPEPEVDPDSLQLLPADENELDMFSAEVSKADMLF